MPSADYTAIADSVIAAMSNLSGQMSGVIEAIIPFALAVSGGVLVVRVGQRTFRAIAGR